MYTVKWKQLLFCVINLLILLSLLAFLSDLSLVSIQAAISANTYELRQVVNDLDVFFSGNNQNVPLTPLMDAWQEGGPPEARSVQIAFSANRLTIDYFLKIKSDHPIAQYVVTGYPFASPKAFVEQIFGQFLFDSADNTLSDESFQTPDIMLDPASGMITAHFVATQNIGPTTSLYLLRTAESSTKHLVPKVDIIAISYAGRKLTSIYPLPTETSEGKLVYRAETPNTLDTVQIRTEVPQNSEVIANIVSRQALLQRVGNLIKLPFISSILNAILEALPFLLFLRLVSSQQGERPRILVFLAELVLALLTFHFAYFLSGGMTNLFAAVIGTIMQNVSKLSPDLLYQLNLSFLYSYNPFGFLIVHIVFVSVLISAMLLRRAKELNSSSEPGPEGLSPLGKYRTRTNAKKKIPWLTIFTVLILLIALVLPLLYFLDTSQNLIDALYYGSRDFVPLSILVFGFTGLLSLLLLRGIYRQLDGRPEIPSIIAIAFWLLLAGNVIWEITYTLATLLESNLINPYSGWGWFGYSTILGSMLVYAFIRIVYVLFEKAGWIRPLTPARNRIIVIFSLITSIPMRLLFSSATSAADYYEVLRLASLLDDLIGFVFLAGLVWYFHEEGQKRPSLNAITLSVGVIAAVTLLYRPNANWLYIPITFILGYRFVSYVFRPAEHWDKLKLLYKRVFKERIEFLEEIVSLNMAERAYRELYKTLSSKMGKGESDYASFKKEIDARRKELDDYNQQANVRGEPIKNVALTFGPKQTAWANGGHGAFWAAIFAVPWIGIWLFNFMAAEATTAPYPLWSFFSDSLNLLLSWIGIGFMFGYFYPYLRGRNGMQKGLWLWAMAVLPSLPLALINNSTLLQWQGLLLWALQMFIHCMLLGLVAFDYMTLRQGYRDWQMLFELHGIPSVGISISSILLAAGTAITALFQAQTQEIIKMALTFILPNADKIINLPK